MVIFEFGYPFFPICIFWKWSCLYSYTDLQLHETNDFFFVSRVLFYCHWNNGNLYMVPTELEYQGNQGILWKNSRSGKIREFYFFRNIREISGNFILRILWAPCFTNESNTLKPEKNGRHFADDNSKCIFLNETYRQFSNISGTQSPNITVSRLVFQLSLPNPLKPRVKLRMKM